MDCFRPIFLKGKGYVPCGKCLPCKKKRQDDWTFRLTQEYIHSTSCMFVTLTYSDDFVPKRYVNGELTNVLLKRDVQLWMKRLRKAISPNKIRFFACGEYGPTTYRPHYHVILFNIDISYYDTVIATWNKGFTSISTSITPQRIAYVAKYVNCVTDLPAKYLDPLYRPFCLCSRRPAIGSQYLTQAKIDYHRSTLNTVTVTRDGVKHSLPKYYKDRIFDDQMKADIRSRSDDFRNKRNAEYLEKYGYSFSIKYEKDMLQQQREQAVNRYRKLIKQRKL